MTPEVSSRNVTQLYLTIIPMLSLFNAASPEAVYQGQMLPKHQIMNV